MLTKKHFKAIANIIKVVEEYISQNCKNKDEKKGGKIAIKRIVYGLMWFFEEDNMKFDRKKFIEACGL